MASLKRCRRRADCRRGRADRDEWNRSAGCARKAREEYAATCPLIWGLTTRRTKRPWKRPAPPGQSPSLGTRERKRGRIQLAASC